MPNSRKCKHCGTFFTPARKDQVYCNEDCRTAYYEEHYWHKVSAVKICPRCGTEFPTSKPLAQTYCTPECRENNNEPLKFLKEAVESEQQFIKAHPERSYGYSKANRLVVNKQNA